MSAYYGGRSEVHIRKTSVQVFYCDFLSMYWRMDVPSLRVIFKAATYTTVAPSSV